MASPSVAALSAALTLILCACGSATDGRLEGPGFSVAIPKGWEEGQVGGGASTGETPEFSRSLAPQASGGGSYVLLEVYELDEPPRGTNLGDALQPTVEGLATATGGRVVRGPEPTTLDDLEAARFEIAVPSTEEQALTSILVFAFEGSTQYFINCQATPAHADTIERGCDRVVASFRRA